MYMYMFSVLSSLVGFFQNLNQLTRRLPDEKSERYEIAKVFVVVLKQRTDEDNRGLLHVRTLLVGCKP